MGPKEAVAASVEQAGLRERWHPIALIPKGSEKASPVHYARRLFGLKFLRVARVQSELSKEQSKSVAFGRVEGGIRFGALARWSWEPSSLPGWLNEKFYANKIQPLLRDIANPVIMSALGISVTYAVAIRKGRRLPHPRHWEALAKLAGVSAEGVGQKAF